MVLDGAGLVAPWANRPVRVACIDLINEGFCVGHQLAHGVDPATAQAILVEVAQQGIEALVSRQDNALGLRLSLDDPAKLKGDVEVQCVLASALDLLEIDSLEAMSRGLLGGGFGRILLCSNIEDGPVAFIKKRQVDLVASTSAKWDCVAVCMTLADKSAPDTSS